MQIGAATVENSMEVPQKNPKLELHYDSAIPLLVEKRQGNKSTNWKRYMYSTIHSGVVYNCQGTEAT